MFQIKLKRISKHTPFVLINFFSKNDDVYEIIWKNMVELDRPQMTI